MTLESYLTKSFATHCILFRALSPSIRTTNGIFVLMNLLKYYRGIYENDR